MSWGLIHWMTHRDKLVGVFVLKQGLGIGFTLATMGYLRFFMGDVFSPDVIDKLGSLLVLTYNAAAIWLDLQLLRIYQPPRWGVRLMQLALLLLPLELVLMFTGQVQTALSLNLKIIFLEPLISLLLFSLSKPANLADGQPPVIPKRAMIILFAVISVAFSTVALVVSGVIPSVEFVMYILFLHGLLTGVVMMVLLQVRATRLQARHLQTQADLAFSEQRALQLNLQRLEQSQFLAMLTHELKTPLSLIHLVLGSQVPTPDLIAYAKRAVQDMNDVIERCLQSEQLTDGQLVTKITAVNVREECWQLQQSCARPARLHLTMQSEVIAHTDEKLLRIVLANLLDNALKYSPPDSAVDIIISSDASRAVAGISITLQNLPGTAGWPEAAKVFQKYYRNSRARHQTGSGLGLYLGHSMAQMLGGELRYAPDELFIRFTLWLPL
jgi:signal transduction histidine kinase